MNSIKGSGRPRGVSTTMAFVRLLQSCCSDKELGKIRRADHSRRSPHVRHGAVVPPVRHLRKSASSTSRSIRQSLLYYQEAKDGQILEEGITEAGSMSSFIAAGTAYATHGVNMIPFLHLLLDVRLPAHRRSDLGGRRHALPRLPAGRHRRPHHPERRRPAAPGRSQPSAGATPCPT